jgi:hypothetical protein
MENKDSIAPTTTAEENLHSANQRRVNLTWEYTQAFIAMLVISTNMLTGTIFALKRIPTGEYPLVLSSSLFLVIGFYFGRTNHEKVGGVYLGR